MSYYRKLPVIIEAITRSCCGRSSNDEDSEIIVTPSHEVKIPTLEGELLANPGDWIIRGVKGELYPCKPDIFTETYESVEKPKPFDPRRPPHGDRGDQHRDRHRLSAAAQSRPCNGRPDRLRSLRVGLPLTGLRRWSASCVKTVEGAIEHHDRHVV